MDLNTNSDIIFTRYLYIKHEVELSLLVSILNKSNDSLFWAYELYFSGFKEQLFTYIWNLYYDFFASLNPTFGTYLLTKYKDFLIDETVVSSIISTLLTRPFNTDIFFLRHVSNSFQIDIDYHTDAEKITDINTCRINFDHWINTNNYRSITDWILNINQNTISEINIYKICLELFQLTKIITYKQLLPLLSSGKGNKNIILLAIIMSLFSQKYNLKKGKNTYSSTKLNEIIPYQNVYISNGLPHYRILQKVCSIGIDDHKHLSLFKLKRHKYNIKQLYFDKWLYYASFSPLWHQRITSYGGIIDHSSNKIIFDDDDLLEEFYRCYGYEPDEQKQCIQNKSIMNIEKVHNWKWFHNKYKHNGLFEPWEEELEEFDNDGI